MAGRIAGEHDLRRAVHVNRTADAGLAWRTFRILGVRVLGTRRLLTLLIVPLQMLLVAFAMRGFNQGWNVELERRDPSAGAELYGDASPHPA